MDVNRWCRECQACNRGKVSSKKKSSPTPIAVPTRRFSHVHVDLVGPLPPSATGHTYLFTMIDRHTRWIEAVPIPNMEASTCADAFIAGWVSWFGVPCDSNIRSWETVYVRHLGGPLQAARHPPPDNYRLPPTKQRDDREGPQTDQGRTVKPRRRRQVDDSPSLDPTGPQGGPQRRQQHILS